MKASDSRPILVLKSVRGRIDYELFNYCATCGYKLPKEMLRCPDCRQKVRTRPWHRPKFVDEESLAFFAIELGKKKKEGGFSHYRKLPWYIKKVVENHAFIQSVVK